MWAPYTKTSKNIHIKLSDNPVLIMYERTDTLLGY